MSIRPLGLSLAIVLAITAANARAQDASSPETAVRSFLEYFENGDTGKACLLVEGGKNELIFMAAAQAYKGEHATIKLEDMKTVLKGDRATVTFTWSLNSPKMPFPTPPLEGSLALHRVNSSWKLVSAIIATIDNSKIHALGLVGGEVWVCANPEAATKLSNQGLAQACLKGIEYIAYGALELAKNHNGILAIRPDEYRKDLDPILQNDTVYHCLSEPGSAVSYSFNAKLAGTRLTSLKSPGTIVLFYEGKDGKLNFRHDGRASVAFADGHVKQVIAEEARLLRWQP